MQIVQKSWLSDARIYQIFIDRYVGWKQNYTQVELKKEWLGGNLSALIDKLSYIKGLGFNSI